MLYEGKSTVCLVIFEKFLKISENTKVLAPNDALNSFCHMGANSPFLLSPLTLGTCNLTTYKFSFSSHASTCNLLKPEQLQQKINYTSSRALADCPAVFLCF